MYEVLIALIILAIAVYIHFGGKLPASNSVPVIPEFAKFPDKYETLDAVADALQAEGLESCNLIVGVDYTASNESQGRKSFRGRSLHHTSEKEQNPYEQVIQIIGKTLTKFDEDGLIPAYGFGDVMTGDRAVFPFFTDRPCNGFQEVLSRYKAITPTRKLSGPTSFVPIINEAIKIVKSSGYGQYHILIIVADGQVTNERENVKAICEASKYPLSIVMIGVGDGPWDAMERFDDLLVGRAFDNFQFVDYHHISSSSRYPEAAFALNALMEIPQQFAAIKRLGYLGQKYTE